MATTTPALSMCGCGVLCPVSLFVGHVDADDAFNLSHCGACQRCAMRKDAESLADAAGTEDILDGVNTCDR